MAKIYFRNKTFHVLYVNRCVLLYNNIAYKETSSCVELISVKRLDFFLALKYIVKVFVFRFDMFD